MERAPRSGPLLIVANHQSHLDPPLVGMCFPHRPVTQLARASLFENPWFGAMIRALNAVPIRDNSGDLGAIRETLERLEEGEAVIVFPEGTRSPDGEVKEFRRGALLLLKRSRCPVLPVAIVGAYDVWPRSRKRPRLAGRIHLIVGEPIAHDDLLRDGPDAALERLRNEVIALRDAAPRA